MDKNTAWITIREASDDDILTVVLGSGFDQYGWWTFCEEVPGLGYEYVCETDQKVNGRPSFIKALVTPGGIRKAWCDLIEADYPGIRGWQEAENEDDLFDLDSSAADCIMQSLVLGRVIFG